MSEPEAIDTSSSARQGTENQSAEPIDFHKLLLEIDEEVRAKPRPVSLRLTSSENSTRCLHASRQQVLSKATLISCSTALNNKLSLTSLRRMNRPNQVCRR